MFSLSRSMTLLCKFCLLNYMRWGLIWSRTKAWGASLDPTGSSGVSFSLTFRSSRWAWNFTYSHHLRFAFWATRPESSLRLWTWLSTVPQSLVAHEASGMLWRLRVERSNHFMLSPIIPVLMVCITSDLILTRATMLTLISVRCGEGAGLRGELMRRTWLKIVAWMDQNPATINCRRKEFYSSGEHNFRCGKRATTNYFALLCSLPW